MDTRYACADVRFTRPVSTRLIGAVLAAVALLWATAPAAAQDQDQISLEARTGVTFPTGDLSDRGYDSGLLFGADVFWTVMPRFSIYGGYAWHRFNCDTCVGDDASASGPRAGLKVLFPLAGDATPWLRGGLSLSGTDGLDGASDPDRELGLEIGGGIDYALNDRFSLTPALHYKAFTQDIGTEETDLSYLTLGLGAHFHF